MLDDWTSAALVVAGVLALAAAGLWRFRTRRSRVERLAGLLSTADGAGRSAAARGLVALGLGPAARPLLAHRLVETDPEVRAAIALAVARRQWEPGGSPAITELREWARDELTSNGYDISNFGPAFTRLSDMGGPRLERPATASTS